MLFLVNITLGILCIISIRPSGSCISSLELHTLCHLNDFRTVGNTGETFGHDLAIDLSGEKFVPPSEQEITSDEFEPGSEAVG